MDQACYGVLCKMSQDYLMRYPLINGQGALGTQENNDMFSSSRYTEAAPSIFSDLMMSEYSKNVVPTKETYNGEFMEPVVLPGLFPNAICNGRQAIGISMAHNSIPNNLTEACNAIIYAIKNNGIDIDELLKIMPGPDFPLPNTVINKDAIKEAYKTGHSKTSLKVRGQYIIEKDKLIFTSIPYRTYRNKIREDIDKNVDEFENFLEDFNDESNLGQNKLVFTMKKNCDVNALLNKLFALTDLQTTISCNMNFIVNGTPKMCSMMDLIKYYIEHQENVMIAAATFDKTKAEKRKRLVDGLLIALGDIDTAITIIKSSEDKNEAVKKLCSRFLLDEEQAKAILDMRLSKLTKLDKKDLEKELKELVVTILEQNKIIEEKEYRDSMLIKKVENMRDKYGDKRRTELLQIEEPKQEAVEVEPIKCVVTLTNNGIVKRTMQEDIKVQHRNSKGTKTNGEVITDIIKTNTVDSLMIFTNLGNMYRIAVDKIPEGGKGINIKTLVNMEIEEEPTLIYSIHKDTTAKYVLFVTKSGLVKKTLLSEYTKTKRNVKALILKNDDILVSVSLVDEEEIIISTKKGMGIRFSISEISSFGRIAQGVKGINLDEGDEVVSCAIIRDNSDDIGVFSANGNGKRIKLDDIPKQNRGGKGVILNKDAIAAIAMVNDNDKVLVAGGTNALCIECSEMKVLSRTSSGTIISKNGIVSVSKI